MNKKNIFIYYALCIGYQINLPALQVPAQIHNFTEATYAHFSGPSNHQYYNSQYPIAQVSGVIGLITCAIKIGALNFISDTVMNALKAGMRRILPQLYDDAETIKLKQLLARKTDLENQLAALDVKAKTGNLLAQSSNVIAEHQKQLAQLRSQPMTSEQQERCLKISDENLELMELQSNKIKSLLKA